MFTLKTRIGVAFSNKSTSCKDYLALATTNLHKMCVTCFLMDLYFGRKLGNKSITCVDDVTRKMKPEQGCLILYNLYSRSYRPAVVPWQTLAIFLAIRTVFRPLKCYPVLVTSGASWESAGLILNEGDTYLRHQLTFVLGPVRPPKRNAPIFGLTVASSQTRDGPFHSLIY